jgi:hypothetical protein
MLSKVPMAAVDVLNERVPPSYEGQGVEIEHLLTAEKYCERPVGHPVELYLAIQQIQHRHADRLTGNQRLLRTLPSRGEEGLYVAAFSKTFYESLEQLQRDLDADLSFYNHQRAHQGYRAQGRTPCQAFLEGVEAMRREEMKPEAA